MQTRTSQTDSRGFTLVELAVVVLIVGVISGIVFTRIDALIPGERLRGSAAEVVGAVRFARSAARSRRIEVAVEYDIDENRLTVRGFFPPGSQEEDSEVILSRRLAEGIRILEVRYGESAVASRGRVTVSFTPSGSVGEHMVTLASDSATAAVYVPALTGNAFVVEDGETYGSVRAARRQR